MTNTPEDLTTYLDEQQAIADAATDELAALCAGTRKFTMRIPADPARDTDLLFGDALAGNARLIAIARTQQAEIEQLRGDSKNGRVDPRLLRWCEWPGCLRSFDATTGPVGDPGWMRQRKMAILLCPEHDGAGHRPSWDWNAGDDFIVGSCQCGASSEERPSNIDAAYRWWAAHVQGLPEVG